MKKFTTSHLVKSEDLNHHGTLFAGRMAEWFTEAAFIAAASILGKPENIVCLKLHGLKFSAPSRKGDIVTISTRLAKAGTTSMTFHGKVNRNNSDSIVVEGFITFVCVDLDGKKMPHNIVLDEPEEKNIREIAKNID